MTTPRLTEEERVRVRYHLGYLSVAPASAIALGYPSAQHALFLVEHAMDRLLPAAVSRVHQIVRTLDQIECSMAESVGRLKAAQVGEVKLRGGAGEESEGDLLEREYRRWAGRLADHLGVALNVHSERFRGTPINVPVRTVD